MSQEMAVIDDGTTYEFLEVGDMKVSHAAQREFKQEWGDYLAAHFQESDFGNLVVNVRENGDVYVIDGQHRRYAVMVNYGEETGVPCKIYRGLTEKEEAEKFLQYNNRLNVVAGESFRLGLTAERKTETAIRKIAAKYGLSVGRDGAEGTVSAVTRVKKIYVQDGPDVLDKTIMTIVEAYGDPGFRASVISGVGLFHARYGEVDMEHLIAKLSGIRGGINGLVNNAALIRKRLGGSMSQCVAAAVVEYYNKGKTGKGRLPDWWK